MELKEGIILKTLKHQESSKLLTILTKDGVSNYVARGALKLTSKNQSYVSEGSIILFNETNKANRYSYITSGKLINPLINFKTDTTKMKYLLYQFELLIHLSNHVTDKALLFELSKQILNKSNESKNSDYYFVIFALKLLYLLGISPSFTKCVKCESKTDLVGFDFNSGGMICANCDKKSHLSMYYDSGTTQVLRLLYLVKIESIDEDFFDRIKEIITEYNIKFDNLINFIWNYYDNYLGFKSQTLRVFNSL